MSSLHASMGMVLTRLATAIDGIIPCLEEARHKPNYGLHGSEDSICCRAGHTIQGA